MSAAARSSISHWSARVQARGRRAGAEFLVQAALAEMLPASGSESGRTVLRHLWLSEQQARALTAQLEDFVTRQHPADAASGEAYGLLLSLYRADIPGLPATE